MLGTEACLTASCSSSIRQAAAPTDMGECEEALGGLPAQRPAHSRHSGLRA